MFWCSQKGFLAGFTAVMEAGDGGVRVPWLPGSSGELGSDKRVYPNAMSTPAVRKRLLWTRFFKACTWSSSVCSTLYDVVS